MDPKQEDSGRVLVFAPIGRDGAASAELLRRAGIDTQNCTDFGALLNGIEEGAAAVFMAEEGLYGQNYQQLASWIERQPTWSDLPFVVLTSKQEQAAILQWRQRLIEVLRNVSLLERPIQGITLMSAIRAALRARKRQYQLRDLLAARERAAQQLEALVVERTRELATANIELRNEIRERERAEKSLRQAQKMEAIGQLTGGVAHDFNNLLMVISAGLQMLERRDDLGLRVRIVDSMRQAIERGARLTRQLLAFSRRTELNPQPVDLSRQISRMRELLERSLRGDVDVRLEADEDLWPVEIDPGELELVILNLAVNARDAMPNGGTIVVRAYNVPEMKDGNLSGDFVRLSVEDNGTGMSEETLQRVFEPFFTTKEVGKGSGLGLAQVYGFAQQSGGTVTIESRLGVGTTVSLLLPRSSKAPAPEMDGAATHIAPGLSGPALCVLLVEDDDEVASLLGQMLDELGYLVTRASNAQAALGALANGRRIDVVFSDIMMPGGMNGIELAREIRRRKPDLPVVLTSGNAEAFNANLWSEGLEILPKPYQLEQLAATLRNAAEHRASLSDR
ncbi:response regulator [Chelativorans sp.]|uniref:response regulator n=1 Tax=Chelativorans sp. TaxID=2203393 RepID=UPI002810D3AF|nr:response regulator [Chelativorans sp.]